MSEPTYEYVKGQGWVASTVECLTFKHSNGRTFRIEKRFPKLDETYVHGNPGWTCDSVRKHCHEFNWVTGINKYRGGNTDDGLYFTVVDG